LDYREHYRNMSLKHLSVYEWMILHCQSAQYLAKVDDDTFTDVVHLAAFLQHSPPDGFYCSNTRGAKPQRLRRGPKAKWAVNRAEFAAARYPAYCEGFGYAVRASRLPDLYLCSLFSKFFWIDDVYVTGVLAAAAKVPLAGFWAGHGYTGQLPSLASEKILDYIFLVADHNEFLEVVWHRLWRSVLQFSLDLTLCILLCRHSFWLCRHILALQVLILALQALILGTHLQVLILALQVLILALQEVHAGGVGAVRSALTVDACVHRCASSATSSQEQLRLGVHEGASASAGHAVVRAGRAGMRAAPAPLAKNNGQHGAGREFEEPGDAGTATSFVQLWLGVDGLAVDRAAAGSERFDAVARLRHLLRQSVGVGPHGPCGTFVRVCKVSGWGRTDPAAPSCGSAKCRGGAARTLRHLRAGLQSVGVGPHGPCGTFVRVCKVSGWGRTDPAAPSCGSAKCRGGAARTLRHLRAGLQSVGVGPHPADPCGTFVRVCKVSGWGRSRSTFSLTEELRVVGHHLLRSSRGDLRLLSHQHSELLSHPHLVAFSASHGCSVPAAAVALVEVHQLAEAGPLVEAEQRALQLDAESGAVAQRLACGLFCGLGGPAYRCSPVMPASANSLSVSRVGLPISLSLLVLIAGCSASSCQQPLLKLTKSSGCAADPGSAQRSLQLSSKQQCAMSCARQTWCAALSTDEFDVCRLFTAETALLRWNASCRGQSAMVFGDRLGSFQADYLAARNMTRKWLLIPSNSAKIFAAWLLHQPAASSLTACVAKCSEVPACRGILFSSNSSNCSLLTDYPLCRWFERPPSSSQLYEFYTVRTQQCFETVNLRVSDALSFDRHWAEYRTGFGAYHSNYFAGLEWLHKRTGEQPSSNRFRVDLLYWNDTYIYAYYLNVVILSEIKNFTVAAYTYLSVSGGGLEDDLFAGPGAQFLTRDHGVSHCGSAVSCAEIYLPHWHGCCHRSGPFGKYFNYPTAVNVSAADRAKGIVCHWHYQVDVQHCKYISKERLALNSWKQLHSAPELTAPFVQRAETPDGGQELYPWVQLSGHRENFRPGLRPGTVLKLLCPCEADCLRQLTADPLLGEFVPRYFGTVRLEDGTEFLEMQDLLAEFPGCTGLMDCKMGSRTYLESELDSDPKPRRDLYNKMVEVDADAPTADEAAAQAVAKPRYMMWREQLSSTATLAFRIDGLQRLMASGRTHPVDLKRLRSRPEVSDTLAGFLEGRLDLRDAYLARLRKLRAALAPSEFFALREFIGSSLLFVHDQSPGHACVWMIDFGKIRLAPGRLSHTADWLHGNHEDGYLTGLDNLIGLFEDMQFPPSEPQ
uniref:Kinase n=2 Tax=Macrostomum lignano TaxID=282301 RepID=A0A1I8IFM3_9PLAT